MDTYRWSTEEPHADNNETMCDYLEYYCPEWLDIYYVDGTYAEGVDKNMDKWEIHASGDGDCFNHKIEFKALAD